MKPVVSISISFVESIILIFLSVVTQVAGCANLLHAPSTGWNAFVGRRGRQTGCTSGSNSAGNGTRAAVGLVPTPSGMMVQHVLKRMRIVGIRRMQVSVIGQISDCPSFARSTFRRWRWRIIHQSPTIASFIISNSIRTQPAKLCIIMEKIKPHDGW